MSESSDRIDTTGLDVVYMVGNGMVEEVDVSDIEGELGAPPGTRLFKDEVEAEQWLENDESDGEWV